MKRALAAATPLFVLGLTACVAPGIQGPGGSVQGTANVEALERQAPVTAAPSDAENAANAALYGSGSRYYRGYYGGYYYGRCGRAPCYYPRYYP